MSKNALTRTKEGTVMNQCEVTGFRKASYIYMVKHVDIALKGRLAVYCMAPGA